MKHRIILAILTILLSFSAYSGPARKAPIHLTQPDGTSFTARIMGDEHMKMIMTTDGCAIIRDSEGWWCHAYYDGEGKIASSGHHVGTPAPSDVLSSSRNIPFGEIAAKSRMKRDMNLYEDGPILKRIMEQRGVETKADDEKITKHGLIILAEFKDRKFKYGRDYFHRMLNQNGYSHNGATGSAKEYFDDQFNGMFNFDFYVTQVVTLPSNMAYYGRNDENGDDQHPEKMIMDACEAVDGEINFADYDDDKDGFVDNVFVFFAGNDEAEVYDENTDCIWSHAWYIYSGADENLVLDGVRIGRYACTSELTRTYSGSTIKDVLAGIGTFCHEYFHTFGIPDMYDSDYDESGGQAAGLWAWTSLMDAGNQNNGGNTPPYLNAVEREYLGISEPETIHSNGNYSLEPINLNGKYYRIDTDHKDEYYLLEYRGTAGWDAHVGGSGMLVYHVDKSNRKAGHSSGYERELTAAERWGDANEVNARPDHQCADIIEGDSRQDSFTAFETESYYSALNNIQGIFLPGPSVTSLLPDSRPGLTYWSGNTGEISITNIKRNGNGVTFNVLGFSESETPPAVETIMIEAFTDAAIISFESDRHYDGEATVTWGKSGAPSETIKVKPYESGKYAFTLEKLQAGNRTYIVKIRFDIGGLNGEEEQFSFMTKKAPTVKWPYIYMGGVHTNSDGSLPAGSRLPLRVYNASDAAEITWTFDGKPVTAGGDGYFTVTKSGTLKVHIIREDGTEESVVKEIIIGKEADK